MPAGPVTPVTQKPRPGDPAADASHALSPGRRTLLFVHHSADLYGADKMLLALLDGLDPSRFLRIVCLPASGPLADSLAQRGIEFHVGPVLKVQRAMFNPAGAGRLLLEARRCLRHLDALLAGRRADLVHSNTLAVLGGALWARLRRVPHLWHVHEIIAQPALARRVFPWLVRALADTVVTNSRATAEALAEGVPPLRAKTQVIPNGLAAPPAPDPARSAQLRREMGAGPEDVLAVLVGRINRWKGQALLVEAMEILAAEHPTLCGAFVGSPPPGQEHFLAALRQRIAASPARNRMRILDFTPDVWNVWEAADIAVVPSMEPEPFGLVAVEAMAQLRPVIAADHGGLAEIVEHGRTGLLFPPGYARPLAEALARLARDREERTDMGRRGRERALAAFGLDRFQDAFRALYANLLP